MARFDLELVLSRADLPEVMRRLGIDIQRTGSGYVALCPFHADTKPSLHMFAADGSAAQHYHCFACNAHGNAIALVKQVKGLDFKAAVEWLAASFGVQPIRSDSPSSDRASRHDRHGFDFAGEVFREAHRADEFESWAKDRGYSADFLYGLGFRLIRGNVLIDAIKKKPLGESLQLADELENSGLVHRVRRTLSNSGGSYFLPLDEQLNDTFRDGRVVFPIHDLNGKVVGYTGRRLSEDVPSTRINSKYLNTKGFQKSAYLFNADRAISILKANSKIHTEHDLYVVEGFMDAVRLHSLGIPAVALMGTSVSAEQLEILENTASTLLPKGQQLYIKLFLDLDVAGYRASERVIRQLIALRSMPVGWLAFDAKAAHQVGLKDGKDPDAILDGVPADTALRALRVLSQPAVAALLLNELGSVDVGILTESAWKNISPYRRDRAIFATVRTLRSWRDSVSSWEVRLAGDYGSAQQPLWLSELTQALSTSAQKKISKLAPNLFLQSEIARRNNARTLAYHGSRRGELPCDDQTWQCLEVAAEIFDALLVERLGSKRFRPSAPFNAVHLPRKLSASQKDLDDPRRKVMPHPADLVFQQYLLNEILTERHDLTSTLGRSFSECVPAVRYYRDTGRTVVTGLERNLNEDDEVMSFAYQIDMEVLEGQRPPSDQGMFRPFGECWRDFMATLNRQVRQLGRSGRVYVLRLDAKRYYDNIRQYVVRDRLQSALSVALASGWPESLSVLKGENGDATDLVRVLCECLFGYPYLDPASGETLDSEQNQGIPQGPVLSAWIGTIVMFPVDEVARALIKRYATKTDDGKVVSHIGYARYVDDIVLIADSADLLRELREAVQLAASELELTLVTKGEPIPPGDADAVIDRLNDGRSFAAYTPTWEPPLFGDGEWGWALGDEGPDVNRQSALRILRHPTLLEHPETVLEAVSNATRALDLRASDLGKCARWIWWRIATDEAVSKEGGDDAAIWTRYWRDWDLVTTGHDWAEAFRKKGFSELIALEGLDRLLDAEPWMELGLSGERLKKNRDGIAALAGRVCEKKFFDTVKSTSNFDHLRRRQKFVRWKAKRKCGSEYFPYPDQVELSQLRTFAVWFCQATALLMSFKSENAGNKSDPLAPLKNAHPESFENEFPGISLAWKFLCKKNIDDLGDIDEARRLALGLIVAATKPQELWGVLNNYKDLLFSNTEFNTLPPLPSIPAEHLLGYACATENQRSNIYLHAFGENVDVSPPEWFFGAKHIDNSEGARLCPPWDRGPEEFGPLQHWRSKETLPVTVWSPGLLRPEGESITHFAARLYRALLCINRQYLPFSNGEDELVPVSSHLATLSNAEELTWYLLAAPMKSVYLGNSAWIRDAGSSLRSVPVPSGDAHLWRIGVTVSDVLGFAQDALAAVDESSGDSDCVTDLGAAEEYVLRQQLRKLRGEFIGHATVRHQDERGLPLTVLRALKVLEEFPPSDADSRTKVFSLLQTEAETQAMAMRLSTSSFTDVKEGVVAAGLHGRLHELPVQVLRRLPLSAIEALQVPAVGAQHVRRDLAIMQAVAEAVVCNSDWDEERRDSAGALRMGVALAVASTGLRGLVASLVGARQTNIPDHYWLPDDWPLPDGERVDPQVSFNKARDAVESDQWNSFSHLSPWCWLLMATTLLQEHLVDTVQFSRTTALLRRVFDILRSWEQATEGEQQGEHRWTWPFEDLPTGDVVSQLVTLIDAVPRAIEETDRAMGFVVRHVHAPRYGFNRHDRMFTDASARTWRMKQCQFSELPNGLRAIERVELNSQVFLIWTEVRSITESDRLLSVHVVDDKLAKLTSSHSEVAAAGDKGLSRGSPQEEPASKLVGDGLSTFRDAAVPVGAETPQPGDMSSTIGGERESSGREGEKAAVYEDAKRTEPQADWRVARRSSWAERAGRKSLPESSYMRVALFQWRIDESYSHPLIEAGLNGLGLRPWIGEQLNRSISSHVGSHSLLKAASACERGMEHLWDETQQVFSWPEHRRRRLLSEAIEACKALKVELLVLPEYSVRAETVKWLQQALVEAPGLAILAGTYRDPDELASPMNLLWMPESALQRLLLPDSSNAWSTALRFARNKKYRAVAVKEFFRPETGPIAPLFDPAEVVERMEQQFSIAPGALSARVVSQFVAEKLPALRYCMELICSELFMLSSPANVLPLARDLICISRRFREEDIDPLKVVEEDLRNLATCLDIGHTHTHPRRSVLVVPAATGRTSDYWLAGQASVLASATATVFCNGVFDRLFLGGSCFIGHESSSIDDEHPGMVGPITPYHGWSKGIYCGKSRDPLGKKDQALVVADLNPVHVVEGKPRPQLLPLPMRLIAYLPVVETLDHEAHVAAMLHALEDEVGTQLPGDVETLLHQAYSSLRYTKPKTFDDLFSAAMDVMTGGKFGVTEKGKLQQFFHLFGEPKALEERFRAWERDRHQQPTRSEYGGTLPPALLDVLPVDLTLERLAKLPTVRVPSWTGDGDPWLLPDVQIPIPQKEK